MASDPQKDKYSQVSPEIQVLVDEFFTMQCRYQAAIREVQTKLEILDNEFQSKHRRNPIHHMQCRMKSIPSIIEKLQRKGLPVCMEAAVQNLTDIAGIRVICSYIDDIYMIADLLTRQDDVRVVKRRDYIQHPKENGYRSLHLVVEVPIYMTRGKVFVKVEIQIRTVAMDFWATLEHRIRYKSTGDVPQEIVDELKDCAELIASTDDRMEQIAKKLRALNDSQEEYAWQSDIERNH